MKKNHTLFVILFLFAALSFITYAAIPSAFDLRNVNGTNRMTSVKSQKGGTCWTFGTMAAMESNLKITGNWSAEGETGEPDLAEYHLDWWNGFNKHNNDDISPPTGAGLAVHLGGDYLVAAAYMTRGDGSVRNSDGQSYDTAPERTNSNYHYYSPGHIEWFKDNDDLYNIGTIKNVIMEKGAIGTCIYYGGGFFYNGSHYQPPSDLNEPNHAVAIAGWDDNKVTQAPTNGAWLCKNSWGNGWNGDGYFWVSYYDKYCGKHPEMGAVSFIDVSQKFYNNIYYHDYHGWRDTFISNTAFNVFRAKDTEILSAVSFYTATNNVEYSIKIFNTFTNSNLSGELISQTGSFQFTGFHTVNLNSEIILIDNQQFCVSVEFSAGGHAYDRTSEIPVLLYSDKPEPQPEFNFEEYLKSIEYRTADKTIVESSANGGESYFWNGGEWIDFTNINSTANFCMKGLTKPIPEPGFYFLFFILYLSANRTLGIRCMPGRS